MNKHSKGIMNRIYLFTFLSMNILILNGCGLAVKGIADTALGGSCDFLVIEPVQNLQPYDNLDIIPFTSSVGGRLNTKLLTYLNNKIDVYNYDNELKQMKGKQLQISGTILHLTDGFYEKQLLMQVKFHDPVTDQLLGLVNVMGEANSLRGLTAVVDSLANSMAELLAENNFSGIKK